MHIFANNNKCQINKIFGYRYTNNDEYDKSTSYIHYKSYISNMPDLNRCTREKLLRHKQIIDESIDYILGQLRRGFDICHVISHSDLRPSYRYYVKRFAETLYKKEKGIYKPDDDELRSCSQKYWVYSTNIKTYGIRDKDLKSKFQAFIEFNSAYAKDDTIKLNLQMTKKAYKHRNEIFLGGFDLIFDDKGSHVRHISEKIVTPLKDNRIERFLSIDAFGNIYSAVIDDITNSYKPYETSIELPDKIVTKKQRETDVKRCLEDIDERTIYSNYLYSPASKLVKKNINAIIRYKHPELYTKHMNDISQNIRNRLTNIIGAESKITLLIQQNVSCSYKHLIKIFHNHIKDICHEQGILLNIIEAPIETINSAMLQYKRDVNKIKYSLRARGFNYKYRDTRKRIVHAYESVIYCILCNYPNNYIIFKKDGKSTKKSLEKMSEMACSVLDMQSSLMKYKESLIKQKALEEKLHSTPRENVKRYLLSKNSDIHKAIKSQYRSFIGIFNMAMRLIPSNEGEPGRLTTIEGVKAMANISPEYRDIYNIARQEYLTNVKYQALKLYKDNGNLSEEKQNEVKDKMNKLLSHECSYKDDDEQNNYYREEKVFV